VLSKKMQIGLKLRDSQKRCFLKFVYHFWLLISLVARRKNVLNVLIEFWLCQTGL
jgi:hypothetical protein